MILYKTIRKEAISEQMIEKSRFIAHVKPINTKEEADEYIKEIKKMHKSANHNVPAMVIGDKFQIQWGSDDGEPQGTSGAPIVQMIVKEGITNVVVVITRYFGGIKLGTGGLVRAYTSSAKLGLEAGGVCEVKEMFNVVVKVGYSYLSKFQNLAENSFFEIGEILYEDQVTMTLATVEENVEELKLLITNITGDKARILDEFKELKLVKNKK